MTWNLKAEPREFFAASHPYWKTPPGHYFWLPPNYESAFTCRMIYDSQYRLDFLSDRAKYTPELPPFSINHIRFELSAYLKKHSVQTNEDTVVHGHIENDMYLLCSPNMSYGYLYMSIIPKEFAFEN